jgi:hypothetical protein
VGPVHVAGGHLWRRGREVGDVFSERRTEHFQRQNAKKSLLPVDCVRPVVRVIAGCSKAQGTTFKTT